MQKSGPTRFTAISILSAVVGFHDSFSAQVPDTPASHRKNLSPLGISFTYFSLSGSPASVALQSPAIDALELRVITGDRVFAPSSETAVPAEDRVVELPPGLEGECIVQVRAKDGPGMATPYVLSVTGMGLSDKEERRADLIAEINGTEAARRKRIEEFLADNYFVPPGDGRDYYIEDIVDGRPVVGHTYNIVAQATNSAKTVVEGGSLGLGLTGKELPPIGVWDPGRVSTTHPEFGGRARFGDAAGSIGSHATHVAGTIAAAGIDARAKGFVPQARILAYSSSGDVGEMTAAARDGMLLSNHSYGSEGFDYYPNWDKVALVSEYYLPIRATGNGGDSLYKVVTNHGNCKNIMTVGSVGDLADGFTGPANVTISRFNRFGPTTDGRIKPDIMSNGQGLYSTKHTEDGVDTYGSSSGTSMATPAALGSMALMQEYYFNTHRKTFMKAATLKGLVIATAHEIGAPGPAYNSGWGLINTRGAVDIILADDGGRGGVLKELTLGNLDTLTFTFRPKAGEIPSAVICWTDPLAVASLPQSAPKLVNDLDLRVAIDGKSHLPWKLDPSSPSDAAFKGDNILDNVEKVSAEKSGGEVMTVRITHKRTLAAPQNFSLIIKGAVTSIPVSLDRQLERLRPSAAGSLRLTRSSLAFTAPAGNHSIVLFSKDGSNLGTVFQGHLEGGRHEFNLGGRRLSAGMIIVRITSGSDVSLVKAMLD